MKSNKDWVTAVILIAGGLFVSFMCWILHFTFPQICIPLCFLGSLSTLAFTYAFMRFRQGREILKNVSEISSVLELLTEDISSDFHVVGKNPCLSEFYIKLNLLRESLKKKEENRLQVLNLVNTVAVNMELEKLLEDLLPKLMDVSNSCCSAFYLANSITNRLEIKSSRGFSKNLYSEFDIALGEGMLGNAANSQEITIIRDIPEDTVYMVRSVIGKIKPKNLMFVPIFSHEQLLGVLVLASIYEFTSTHLEFVNLIKHYIGIALTNGIAFEKTKRMSNELKFQNKLIQNLNDELEKNVQERTNFINDVLDSIKSYAIYAFDKDGKIMAWNKCAENILGYRAIDVIGKHINSIYPDGDVKSGKIRDKIAKAELEGRYVENFCILKNDGSKSFVLSTIFARYNQYGEITGYTNVIRDLTDLKKPGLLLMDRTATDKMLKESSSAYLIVNDDCMIVSISESTEKILGEIGIIGRYLYELFENEDEMKQRFEKIKNLLESEEWGQTLKNFPKYMNINMSTIIDPQLYEKSYLVSIYA